MQDDMEKLRKKLRYESLMVKVWPCACIIVLSINLCLTTNVNAAFARLHKGLAILPFPKILNSAKITETFGEHLVLCSS